MDNLPAVPRTQNAGRHAHKREHLFAIKLSNDNLREFLNSWDEVMLEMTDEVDEGTLAMQF